MFASTRGSRAKRRGIVLVLVLGMLGLMALIGVTFATFAGQSLINSRNFQQGVSRPQAEVLMDYALAQLINDTNNPLSAIRGHSLLRDMYGNDSVFRGSNPSANPAAETGGILASIIQANGTTATPQFTAVNPHPTATSTPFYNQVQYTTNIPTTGQYYGLDFTRWIVRVSDVLPIAMKTGGGFADGYATQTFEVIEDDATGTVHHFTLSNNLTNPTIDPRLSSAPSKPLVASDWATFMYPDANFIEPTNGVTPNATPGTYHFAKASASLAREWNFNVSFVLDGRNMRAFNGPGLTAPALNLTTAPLDVYPYNYAAYGNLRIANIDPDAKGMDEDYDACDLENWYLAIQSADGQVVVPSFHRPGILMASDWTASATALQRAKILRPRQADNSPLFPADPAFPDSTTGKITYDLDNDGDGATDSVWLDLGYPVQRDPGGKMYKPLFAFMILGLNGRLPLNTVGNLQARANPDQANNAAAGLVTPPTSTGQVPYPGVAGDSTGSYYKQVVNNGFFTGTYVSSETYLDAPLWDHASHLGYSVNEINPKFALQNAPSNVYPSASSINNTSIGLNVKANNYSQVDDAGVSVALTQLRNILAGTVPTDIATARPYPDSSLPVNSNTSVSSNGDVNVVIVDGHAWVFPNNMADLHDINNSGGTATYFPVSRGSVTPVPGRWGEPSGITANLFSSIATTNMSAAGTEPFTAPSTTPPHGLTYPGLIYNNPVRAGRSVFSNRTNDAIDDDFDSIDTVLTRYPNESLYYAEPPSTVPAYTPVPIDRLYPESSDTFDALGQRAVASERIRQFVTPIDPAGVGRVVSFMTRPSNDHDYGTGSDARGRAGYFRYFRPAGMPQQITYPYGGAGSTYNYPYFPSTSYRTSANAINQKYLLPQLFPAGAVSALTQPQSQASDLNNNRYHGYQSMLTPEITSLPVAAGTPLVKDFLIASMAAMPYDWDFGTLSGAAPGVPAGYPNGTSMFTNPSTYTDYVNLTIPTIRPDVTLQTNVNTYNGPNLGSDGNNYNASSPYPIPYGGYTATTDTQALSAPVVNGYLGGSLNKDEADEMNLYTSNRFDMPYGPSDLEWLYRLQDVDGSTLSSRLSQLAPISFLNPADGLTRRRLFSTDSWEPTGIVYANDNPIPYAGVAYNTPTFIAQVDQDFTYNSRFAPVASPSFEIMNQVAYNANTVAIMANPITTEYLPNVTLPSISPSHGTGFGAVIPNSSYSTALILPTGVDTSTTDNNPFKSHQLPSVQTINGVVVPSGNLSMLQVQTAPLAHRDRRINLNFPLPISHEPAEPVRQKWCRDTYQTLKAILPPAAVDTPEELAALSQFVVNIIDFRDPDCAMTRFVNTDLIVTDVLTKRASNVQPITGTTFDKTWNVSPAGVRFAGPGDNGDLTTADGTVHFPYDPSIYSPDVTTPFLVQHGMEYNPIAINEVLAYQFLYTGTMPTAPAQPPAPAPPVSYPPPSPNINQGLFIELVNTLTEEQNNNKNNNGTINASSISLEGWDLVMTPDNYGWGRPDPISGDVSTIAYPPLQSGAPPSPPPANQAAPFDTVRHFTFSANDIVPAINSGIPAYFVVGAYNNTSATPIGSSPPANAETASIIPTRYPKFDTLVPSTNANSFLPQQLLPSSAGGSTPSRYYWVYLRRPANPFDTSTTPTTNYNREMVVVDAMRFPYIDAGSTTTGVNPTNEMYSARRLQPYRGGHLIRTNTPVVSGDRPASGVTTICPPSPAFAYGYSEQMSPTASSTGMGKYNNVVATKPIKNTIGGAGTPQDTNWSMLTFHDRDFTSVAELLMVPGCPPGLFTKQFVEEPYPGNVTTSTYQVTTVTDSSATPTTSKFTTVTSSNPYATGSDDTDLYPATSGIVAPIISGPTNPTPTTPTASGTKTYSVASTTYNPVGGRNDFNQQTGAFPIAPTFPYLPHNFFYTGVSVNPPSLSNLPTGYTSLTTEIGGWTGNGWHKMMEFFEVPSSANGAIGTADSGVNFDWARNDLKPGLLNLNLIIDEEVFAGLFDDPRLNERLAAYTTSGPKTLPQVVTQIDSNGYAYTHYPISSLQSINQLNSPLDRGTYGQGNTNPVLPTTPSAFGRGYVVRTRRIT